MDIKEEAYYYAQLLKTNAITKEVAYEKITPYINECNAKAKELGKKYNVKPKLVSLQSFIRWI